MTPSIDKIKRLSRAEALEAMLALEPRFLGGPQPAGDAYRELTKLQEKPLVNLVEIEELARLGLVVAAALPETSADVEAILNATGKKAFVFGGAEIMAAASVAVLVLHMCFSKGKSEQTTKIKIRKHPDGTAEITIEEKTVWGVSAKLAALVKTAFGDL